MVNNTVTNGRLPVVSYRRLLLSFGVAVIALKPVAYVAESVADGIESEYEADEYAGDACGAEKAAGVGVLGGDGDASGPHQGEGEREADAVVLGVEAGADEPADGGRPLLSSLPGGLDTFEVLVGDAAGNRAHRVRIRSYTWG